MQVERITTPLSRAEMAQVLIEAHRRYFGGPPSAQRLAVSWSHCALEHAAGAKLYNFNFGNVTCGPGWEGDFYAMRVPPPDPPLLRFRAFASAELGAEDYWGMLDRHYRPALRLFDEGRAYDASMTLGILGYYTARRETYAGAVSNYKAWFDRELASSYVAELAEGKGNSLLTDAEIATVLASHVPLELDDSISSELRDRPTDPSLETLPPTDES